MIARANNPIGADCGKILVVMQRLLAAAQPERYAALFVSRFLFQAIDAYEASQNDKAIQVLFF